jgi:hypothetical protein
MATKNHPGTFDCYDKAHPDEPMFILLGRDPMAGALVREWVHWRAATGEQPAKLAEALRCAIDLDAWAASLGKTARPFTEIDTGPHAPSGFAPSHERSEWSKAAALLGITRQDGGWALSAIVPAVEALRARIVDLEDATSKLALENVELAAKRGFIRDIPATMSAALPRKRP